MLTFLRHWFGRPNSPGALPGERDPLGPAGEKLAAKFLRRKGFRVLGRNLCVPMGEADILCEAPDGRTIVLVEVKSRRVRRDESQPLYAPEVSVTADKRRKLVQILRHLVRANGWSRRGSRIDVVAIEWPETGEPVMRHHENAVEPSGRGLSRIAIERTARPGTPAR